jgi:hypothetical protein
LAVDAIIKRDLYAWTKGGWSPRGRYLSRVRCEACGRELVLSRRTAHARVHERSGEAIVEVAEGWWERGRTYWYLTGTTDPNVGM